MTFFINTLTIFFYLFFYILEQETGFSPPLQIVAITMLCFIVPYNIYVLLPWKYSSFLDKILFCFVLFFFVYTPVYYILHNIFDFSIAQEAIFVTNIIIIIVTHIVMLVKKTPLAFFGSVKIPTFRVCKETIRCHALLVFGIAAYGIIHGVNHLFYKFIPELDSYTDLLLVERFLETGIVDVAYRGFFYMAVSLMASFGSIDPYTIFSFWFVVFQGIFVIVLYRFIDLYRIRNIFLRIVVLMGSFAVPVINMEIGIIRPQNVLIMFFPVYFYFLYRAITKREILSWIVSSAIVIGGLNYHEVFTLLFLVHIGWAVWFMFCRYVMQSPDKKDKYVFLLGSALIVSLFFHMADRVRLLKIMLNMFWRIFSQIQTGIKDFPDWNWWFLGYYQTDGEHLQMGWPGIEGAIKYYSYYVSPFLLCIAVLLVLYVWRRSFPRKDPLLISITPVFLVLFAFSEILPRINFFLLPERFWIFSSMLFLLASFPLLKTFEKTFSPRSIVFMIFVFLTTISLGIGGSWYIAFSKGGVTSLSEHKAAKWIAENTHSDAIFITQAGNAPMVKYFARRRIVVPNSDVFMSDDVFSDDVDRKVALLENRLKQERQNIENTFQEYMKMEFINFDVFIDDLLTYKKTVQSIQNEISDLELLDEFTYILYSEQKFNSLYAEREWWKNSNFYGANIEKFQDTYPLVYSRDGIYIWRVE